MVNLQKQLQQRTSKAQADLTKFEGIDDVKQLLEANGARETQLLRDFGLNDVIQDVEERRGASIQLERITQEFGESFRMADIRELAIDYNLRFLPLEKYNGGIDSLLAAKILQFCDKHGLNANTIAYSNSFYILAPYEDFKLTRKVHPRPIRQSDPLLFYKSDRGEQVWTFVHKWGSEFTFMRLMRAMKFVNSRNWLLSKFMLFFPIWCFILPFIGDNYQFSTKTLMILASLLSIVCTMVSFGRREMSENNDFKYYFTKDNFTSDFSRKSTFA